jgi:Tfp pilus assembly protein PilO
MMNHFNHHFIFWLVTSLLKKLGSWGIVGMVLSAFSIIFYLTKIPELTTLTQATQTKLQAITVKTKIDPEVEITAKQEVLQDIDTFYDRFPSAVKLPETLSKINKLASNQNLALNNGDYKFNKIKQTTSLKQHTLTKYEIVLPVTGQYPKIRIFIENVLDNIPALALADIQLTRENTLSTGIEAKLVFILFVKGESW